ncbi:hypothetical protein ACFLQU_02030 [Verrucomicrobiota bacterium]
MTLNAEMRKKCIEMARRRAEPGAGSSGQLLRERSDVYGTPDIRKYLGDVRFAVVGGLATRLYMPERMTLDADALIAPDSIDSAEAALAGSGCKKLGTLTIGGSTWSLPGGTNLDLIAPGGNWVGEALDSTVNGPGDLPYVSLPYLVLMKLRSGRMQDLADISRMLGAADDDALDRTREVVGRHRASDLEDLESLISLGKLEYEQE